MASSELFVNTALSLVDAPSQTICEELGWTGCVIDPDQYGSLRLPSVLFDCIRQHGDLHRGLEIYGNYQGAHERRRTEWEIQYLEQFYLPAVHMSDEF